MTEEQHKPEENSEQDKGDDTAASKTAGAGPASADEQGSPEVANTDTSGRAPFVMPPFRERVHSRKLQQPQPAPEATSESPPELNSYFSRTPARGLPAYTPQPADSKDVSDAPNSSELPKMDTTDFTPTADLVLRAVAELRSQPAQLPETNFDPVSDLVLDPVLDPGPEPTADNFASQFFVEESAPTIDPREAAYIAQQELALRSPAIEEKPLAPPCRHEYVRIFQRKLKDLNRRMVCTKAYLPTGFKMGDFQHLGENSFCFCAKCRARLYPKRSQAEKAEARVQLAQAKALKLEQQSMLGADLIEEVGASALKKLLMHVDGNEDDEEIDEVEDENSSKVDIHVEEMEQEAVEVEDLDVEGLKANQEEEDGELFDQEEN